ncbi:MAG TPA: PilZ domain-containing protein [Bacillota bacterium]|nr:PilZ domain-containing protein [Bacillota bacterium]
MKKINFVTNNKIEFLIENKANCVSLIQGIADDCIFVTIPAVGFQWRLLNVGDTVECVYYADNGSLYMFDAQILYRLVENIPLYKISFPKTYKRIQRRDFVRAPVYVPVLYRRETSKANDTRHMLRERSPDEIEDLFEGTWQRASTLDLSGGGMKLCTKTPLEADTNLITIIRDDELEVAVKGRVIRCRKHVGLKVNYHSGIKFIGIHETIQDKIISYIFEKIRQMSKREI